MIDLELFQQKRNLRFWRASFVVLISSIVIVGHAHAQENSAEASTQTPSVVASAPQKESSLAILIKDLNAHRVGTSPLSPTLQKKLGLKPASVNCGVGRYCADGQQCCIIGVSFWCCDSNQSCDYENFGCN